MDKIYFIYEGCVIVEDKLQKQQIYLSRGSYFGETEILFNRYHKYKYIADNDLKLYTLDAEVYLQLLEKFPHLKEIFKIRAWHKNQVFHEINVTNW